MKLLVLLAVGAFCVQAKSVRERIAEGVRGRHQCEFNGHSYKEGDDLPTGHLCLSCQCTKDFLEPNSHQCGVIECPNTLHVALGCLPIYNDTECCPVAWDCESRQSIKEKCDERFFQHYVTKGCTPVHDGSDCPVRFECPKNMEYDRTKCQLKGRLYEDGDDIVTSNPCQKCYCGKSWMDDGSVFIECTSIECPRMFRPALNESCREVFDEDTCCSNRIECNDESVEEKSASSLKKTCEHEGRTYQLGDKIYSKEESCLICRCTEDWTGIYGKGCRIHECNLEMKREQLKNGCIPIYHEATCCPIEFHCYTETDVKPENFTLPTSDTENSCLYGGLHYPLGYELDIQHPTNCVTCSCSTPPEFTCVHKNCPGPPNNDYDNCVSTYLPGKCCATYECDHHADAVPAPQCSPVQCPAGCSEVSVHNSCPFCQCHEKLCSIPKCESGCQLDTDVPEGECFRCKCPIPVELACSPVKCAAHCHEVTNPEGCPVCVCGPLCSPPNCEPGCYLKRDVSEGECPACSCPDTSHPGSHDIVHCSPVKCGPGCPEVVSADSGCPTCSCGPLCAMPKCDPGCSAQPSTLPGGCPQCVCGDRSALTAPLCAPVKCGPLCHEAFVGEMGCPTCICDAACSPPKCDPGCHLDHDPKAGPCPSCKCEDQVAQGIPLLQCSPPKCDEGCRIDYSSKPCPSCECHADTSELHRVQCSIPICPEGCRIDYASKPCPSCKCVGNEDIPDILCSPPKCDDGCQVDYNSRPCPSCSCGGTRTGIPDILCSPPKCGEGCRVDYGTKPCPSCQCGSSSSVPDILCSPPKCGEGCRVDYTTKPCPSCKCGSNTGLPDILCSPVKCDGEGCQIDYSTQPCPSCKCGLTAGIPMVMCSPPKCDDPGCSLDYSAKPCPSCSCSGKGIPDILCYPPKCDEGCRVDYATKPCPSCKCDSNPGQPDLHCSSPHCEEGCSIDYSSKPCPSCRCGEDIPTLLCSPPKCDDPGCSIDYSAKPCPSCSCKDSDSQLIRCSPPKCDPGCSIDYNSKPCPSCSCSGFETVGHHLNVFLDPYCSMLKCGPGCERALSPSSPNERCPGCICRGTAGQRKTCGAMQCELPCRFERFSPHGCPICLCHPIPCPKRNCSPGETEEKVPGERCPKCVPIALKGA